MTKELIGLIIATILFITFILSVVTFVYGDKKHYYRLMVTGAIFLVVHLIFFGVVIIASLLFA